MRNEGSIRVGAYMNVKKSRERRPLLGDTWNYGETGDGLLPRIQKNVYLWILKTCQILSFGLTTSRDSRSRDIRVNINFCAYSVIHTTIIAARCATHLYGTMQRELSFFSCMFNSRSLKMSNILVTWSTTSISNIRRTFDSIFVVEIAWRGSF